MCGLVGIAGKLQVNDEDIMKRLLVLDFFRGPHSTGLAAITTDEKVRDSEILKMAVNPIDFFGLKAFDRLLSAYQRKAFIGHNRYATVGKIDNLNAHPFNFGHIYGAHNGTLFTKDWDNLDEMSGEKTAVDSAGLYAAIAACGVEEVIPSITTGDTSREGAWALTWYDEKENTMNFIRNKHRPLWYAFDKEFKRIVWASEYHMINSAVVGSKLSKNFELATDKKGNSFFAFEADTLYSIDMDELEKGFDSMPDFRICELEGQAEPKKPLVSYGNQTNNHGNNQTTYTSNGSAHSGNGSSVADNVVHIWSKDSNPVEDFLTEEQFYANHNGECQCCQAEIDIDDEGFTYYVEDGIIICADCTGESEKKSPTTRIYAKPEDVDSFRLAQGVLA